MISGGTGTCPAALGAGTTASGEEFANQVFKLECRLRVLQHAAILEIARRATRGNRYELVPEEATGHDFRVGICGNLVVSVGNRHGHLGVHALLIELDGFNSTDANASELDWRAILQPADVREFGGHIVRRPTLKVDERRRLRRKVGQCCEAEQDEQAGACCVRASRIHGWAQKITSRMQ